MQFTRVRPPYESGVIWLPVWQAIPGWTAGETHLIRLSGQFIRCWRKPAEEIA